MPFYAFFPWVSVAAAEGPDVFPNLVTVGWTFINFVVLLWALNRWLFRPLMKAIRERESEIQGNLDQAAKDRADAERLRQEFAQQVADAQRHAQETISEAGKRAQVEYERIVGEARQKATEELERAQKQIAVERERALSEIREVAADLAVRVAGKVIEKSLDDADHARLAKRFVEEVGAN